MLFADHADANFVFVHNFFHIISESEMNELLEELKKFSVKLKKKCEYKFYTSPSFVFCDCWLIDLSFS